MKIKVPNYTASERQTLFHTSQADETLYGGAAGGGKTAALVAEAVTFALQNPGARVYVFRKTLPEIEQSIAPEIYKQCAYYIDAGHMHFDGKRNQWRFKNGSIIRFAYLQHATDVYKYQSAEIHLLLIDELTHFTQDEYEYLKTRVRGVNNMRKRIMCATNPGGVGHGWVKAQFIDPAPPETLITEIVEGETFTRQYIPAKVDDHPDERFKKDYRKRLIGIKDSSLRKALLDGDWNQFTGQVFTEWRREKHVVKPFPIPAHWPKWMGYDHGYNTQAAVGWYARDPQAERIYKYRELYVTKTGVNEIASLIRQLEGEERVMPRFADPSIWKGAGNQNTGETVADMFVKERIIFTPANNDRIAGKQAWHNALSIAPDGLPKMQVFESCVETIRTIPSLPYDKSRVEDVDTHAEDHIYDEGRYALLGQRHSSAPGQASYKPRDMVQQKYGN